MLEWQHVPIQMTGLDTKTDDKNSIPGTFVDAENVYMLKTGKIQNRHGYKFPSNPVTHQSQVIATIPAEEGNISIRRDGIYYFDEINGNAIANTTSSIKTMGFNTALFAASIQNTAIKYYTMSTSEDYISFAYVYDTNNYLQIYHIDRASNTIISELQYALIQNINSAPVSVNGNVVFYAPTGGASIIKFYENGVLSSYQWSTSVGTALTSLEADASTNYYVVLVKGSANEIRLGIYNKNTHVWTNVNVGVVAIVNMAVTIDESNSRIVVVYQDVAGNDFYFKEYNLSGTLTTSYLYGFSDACTKLSVSSYKDSFSGITREYLLFQYTGAYGKTVAFRELDGSGGSTAGTFTLYNYEMVSKILLDTSDQKKYFILKNSSSTINSAYFLYQTQTASADDNKGICSYCYGEAVPQQDAAIFTASNSLIEINDFILPFVKFNPSNISGTYYSLIVGSMKADTTTNLPQMVEWNGSAITNAWGTLRTIDTKVTAYPLWTSWPIAAPAPTLVGSTDIGTFLGTGTYYYTIIYTAYDIDNNVIYSSPLNASSITFAAGTNNITEVTPSAQSVFLQYPRYSIAIYRTEANGTVFYFVANTSNATAYLDKIPDTTLITNRALYTTGNLVDSAPAPIAKFLALAKSRLFMITSESSDLIYFSKKQYPNEAPQFNSIYVIKVQRIGGDLEAIAEMDDKIVIFRRNAVFVCYGDGPDELGNGGFSDPQLITQSLGCKQGRSIVLNDKGLMFMSYEGIYMITRGLTVEYVGAAVEQYNSLNITQAINLVDRHEVWFYSSDGTTLVYNDFYNTWYAFVNQPTYAANMSNNGTPYYYRTTSATKYPGRLMIEDSNYYYDGAADNPITITLESGWLSLAGVQGFQRMRTFSFLGKLNNTATLKLYNDFEAAENETFSILPATVGTNPAQYQLKPIRQRTQSVKYKITLTSLSAAFEISSLAIEAGVKRGTVRFDRSKRISS